MGQRKISNWTFLWKYDISKEGLIWFAGQSEMSSGLYHIYYIEIFSYLSNLKSAIVLIDPETMEEEVIINADQKKGWSDYSAFWLVKSKLPF